MWSPVLRTAWPDRIGKDASCRDLPPVAGQRGDHKGRPYIALTPEARVGWAKARAPYYRFEARSNGGFAAKEIHAA